MVKYRIEFSKYGETKFVSHLDLVRLFTRAFKRAELPLAYSEGFNPHPKMSIGIPLSVGVTSECELLDAEFDSEVPEQEIRARMNEKLPLGVVVTRVMRLGEGTRKLSAVARALYRVTLRGASVSEDALAAFLGRKTIEIEKKTKSSEKQVDIKPEIFSLGRDGDGALVMELATGSSANLKPDVVIEAMRRYLPGFAPEDYETHRVRLSDERGRSLMENAL